MWWGATPGAQVPGSGAGPCAFSHARPRPLLGSLPNQQIRPGRVPSAASRRRMTRWPTAWRSGCPASPTKTGMPRSAARGRLGCRRTAGRTAERGSRPNVLVEERAPPAPETGRTGGRRAGAGRGEGKVRRSDPACTPILRLLRLGEMGHAGRPPCGARKCRSGGLGASPSQSFCETK